MKEFVRLRAKTCILNDGSEHKKAKGTKKYVIKRRLMLIVVNNRWLRIWKNKCIIEFNKQPARY